MNAIGGDERRKTPEMVGKDRNVWFEKDRKIRQIKEQPK
jgi:hypothetical protein